LVHACTAVGWFQDTVTLRDMTLAQVYSLNWVNQDEPPLGGTITSSISSVSCGKYCTEAGNSLDSNGEPQGFIQYGSFNNWNYRQVANLANSTFNGLWCASTEASCVVVGETRGPAPLAEVFNGIAFAVASTPLPAGATDGGFYSVSCSSPTNCLAVGFYDVSDNEHALAETWNGSQWSLADPPEPTGSTYTVLNGVSCTTSSCVAVGNYGDPSFNQQPLSEVYTAGSWTTPTVSLPAGGSNPDMTSVSCGATNACLAVGQYFNGSADVPLAAKWNGATWASQKPPAPSGSAVTSFLGVACTSATSCEAVGSWNDSSSNSYTLAEGLNGKAWTIQTTPSTGDTNSEFLGVSCSSATSCTGVGDVSGPSPMSVLVETYS
ncbi:MAG TPA: hypothetical protein VGS19_12415, partial [Streptosporangiaceae bacterium]|nr:hypothetical protein [Streptosporangiaceae bacterium]